MSIKENGKNKLITRSIFGESANIGFGYSNVHDVFRRTSSSEIVDFIGRVYAPRCAHIPDTTQTTGIIVSEATPSIVNHFEDYVAATISRPLKVQSVDTLNGQHQGALVVPFINTSFVESQFADHGMKVWGLPGRLVDVLKNKADTHRLIDRLAIPGFQTPDYRIVHINDLETESTDYLQTIRDQYRQTGMEQYPVGLMFRAAESDGNYGACFIKEGPTGFQVTPNGSSEESICLPNQTEALKYATTYLRSTGSANVGVEPRVVVSRLMDLADSPGLSAVLLDGHFFSLGWNGQVKEQNSSACIGTTNYRPLDNYLSQMQSTYELPTTRGFENFLRASYQALSIDGDKIRGVANADFMIPGKMEAEFQKRMGQTPQITVAEINPRFTNWTDALLFVVAARNEDRSLDNIYQAIKQGVVTQDKFHFEPGTNMLEARELVRQLDNSLKVEGSRILVRMMDAEKATMGVVFTGNIPLAQRRLSEIAHIFS